MYFTRLQVVTIFKEHREAKDQVISVTEFGTPAKATGIKRQALQYHEKLSDAISLLTENNK